MPSQFVPADKPRTVVFLPLDAHGHTNAMLSLAGELNLLNYRTIFITNTTETPKLYGHELILLDSKEDANKSQPDSHVLCEQDVFLGAKLFDHDWEEDERLIFDVDLADGAELDEVTFRNNIKNFRLWARVWNKTGDTDAHLEKILIDIRPDLVVTELLPIRPALIRLANNSYARKVAGWKNGLRWMQLASLAPLWLHHFAYLASKQHPTNRSAKFVPPPFFGLPVKHRLEERDYKIQSDRYMSMMRSCGVIGAVVNLAKLAMMENLARDTSDAQIAQLFINESQWLNVFMYPEELDYEQDFECKLNKSRWLRVDSLVRPTSSCSKPLDSFSEQLLADLASWQDIKKSDPTSKVIYVSLGTVVSENFGVMGELMQQVFTCLSKCKHWRIAVSLGKKNAQLYDKYKDQFDYWQNEERRLLARGWWPQPEVFKRHLADACVVHGGNNTTCELFHYAPVPALVVVPGIGDQLDNARRLAELDFAVTLPVGRLLRDNPQIHKETVLMECLSQAIRLHESSRPEDRFKCGGPRRDARYCARVVSAKLEKETFGIS